MWPTIKMTMAATVATVIGRRAYSFSAFCAPSRSFGRGTSAAPFTRHFSSMGVDTSSDAQQQMRDESNDQAKILHEHFGQSDIPEVPVVITADQSDGDLMTFVEDQIDTVMFDCDGVLYRTQDACPYASETIRSLMKDGKRVLFVTNNAGVNRRQLRDKLSKVLDLGDDLSIDQMVSSSFSSSSYLERKLPKGSRVHVIGGKGLCEEIEAAGFDVSSSNSDAGAASKASMDRQELADHDFSSLLPIDALVVGHDTDFTFRKLSIANHLLLKCPDALFVATNHDSFDIVGIDDPRHIPGNGCVVRALEHCSRRESVNVGKPSSELDELLQYLFPDDYDPERSLFVGDRLDTDISFGKKHGMRSLLVMTGVTTAEQVKSLGPGTDYEPLPDFVAPHVGFLQGFK